MRYQLERRLEALKNEFAAGRTKATELEQQQTTLHQTLVRISGAIQVLEEELKVQPQDGPDNNRAPVDDATRVDASFANGAPAHVGT